MLNNFQTPDITSFKDIRIHISTIILSFSLEQRNDAKFEKGLDITLESMKQLDLIPEVIHDSTVDYVYPLVLTMSFIDVGALAIGLVLWTEHNANNKRFDDVIKNLNTSNDEVDAMLARVTFRTADTREPTTTLH